MNENGVYLSDRRVLSNTPAGRRKLQEAIQPRYDARGNISGFLVTVYDDPLHPSARAQRTVFVDSVYANGTNFTSPNMFSIFESTYGQLHPDLSPVKLHRAHAYMVESADEGGVTLINPHGVNYEDDWTESSARLKLSWEDFGHYFGNVTIGE